jgi:hypothetical protein
MEYTITRSNLADIQALRNLFLSEINFQFVYNKCHGAGWADVYLFSTNETAIGYGSVWGKDKREDRDAVFEFYLTVPFRKNATRIFADFIKTSQATYIECQSNDRLLTSMLFEFSSNIYAERVLFEDNYETTLDVTGTRFIMTETSNGDTEYKLEKDDETVATGGFVWNYNFPFIDIYYEVQENHRRKGYGSLITQELNKEAYRLSRVPAARCNIKNTASRQTLLKAGMGICGYILIGEIARTEQGD